jgi:Fe-S-cluster containining protein
VSDGPEFDVRDPSYRPLLGAQALTTFERLEDRSPRALLEMLEHARGCSDDTADALPALVDPKRRLPVCRKGCSYCCHSTVLASAPEILAIAAHVRSLPEAHRAVLEARIRDAHARSSTRTAAERAAAGDPCPLLDPGDGSCAAHDVRPFACRAYHSLDVEPCRRAFEAKDPNPVLPIDVVAFRVPHAASFGVMAGLRARGLAPGPFELIRGLHEALAHADPTSAWLANEAVFTDDAASRDVVLPTRSTIDTLAHDVLHGGFAALDLGAVPDPPRGHPTADDRRRARNKRKKKARGR